MQDEPETLGYHGRRSVDELVGALNAESTTVALVHRELALLHLDRFVALMTQAAAGVHRRPTTPPGLTNDDRCQ